jgi:hypothetical protein
MRAFPPHFVLVFVAVAIIASLPTQPARAGDTLELTNAFDFSSGRYGERQTTDILYDALVAKYKHGDFDASLTLPYLQISGPANVLPNLGSVGGNTGNATRRGLGDVILSAEQDFSLDALPSWDLEVTGKVKLGTASYSKSLGTGETDYELSADVTRVLSPAWSVDASIGYRFAGSPQETGLRDIWVASASTTWQMTPARSAGITLAWRQQPAPSGHPEFDATVFVQQKISPEWSVTGYAAKGFALGSPDVEAGVMLTRKFGL